MKKQGLKDSVDGKVSRVNRICTGRGNLKANTHMKIYTTSPAMKGKQTQVKSEVQYFTRSDGKISVLSRVSDIVYSGSSIVCIFAKPV